MSSVNMVLFEPEIPQNTGNIMRTCVATNTILHLIEPLGFKLDDNHMRRSGVNYLQYLDIRVYKNFDEFITKNIKNNPNAEMYFLSRYGKHSIYEVDAKDNNKDYFLILGKESTGIPKEILKKYLDRCIRLPMTDKVRALNVSNVAAIMIYEVYRQLGFPNMYELEPSEDKEGFKGADWLEK